MITWQPYAALDDIRQALVAMPALPPRLAIATLVEVDGSAPRDVGAQMLITPHAHWGFLSGGCIEDDVAQHGRAALADGAPRLLRYGEGSPWIDIKLACGSGITVLVEPVAVDDPALAVLCDGWRARFAVLWSSDGSNRSAAAQDHAAADSWDGTLYTRFYPPPLRLVLIGEDGAALTAASLALTMGWQVALVAPGGAEAAPLSGITYHRGDPAAALASIAPDRWTAIAVLSHDREDDERALAAALQSDAFYVGAIGARARLDARIARLQGQGVGAEAIARLRAPIGLAGFGKAPRDVALSLVAEVAQAAQAAAIAARSAGVSTSISTPGSAVSQ